MTQPTLTPAWNMSRTVFTLRHSGNAYVFRTDAIQGLASCSDIEHTYTGGCCLAIYTTAEYHIRHLAPELVAQILVRWKELLEPD